MNVLALTLLAALTMGPQDDGPKPAQDTPEIPAEPAVPIPLRPFAGAWKGLEGQELELTRTVAASIGSAVVRADLGPELQPMAQESRKNWNYIVKEALARTAKQPAGSLFGGGLSYTSGMLVAPDESWFKVVGDPEFRLDAVEDVTLILERRRLVGGLRNGLTQDEAKELLELLEPLMSGDAGQPPPIGLEAYAQVQIAASGEFEEYKARRLQAAGQRSSWDRQQDRIAEELTKALIQPLRPKLDARLRDERGFRFQGEYVLQVVDPEALTESGGWAAPLSVLAANRADGAATLLVQVPPRKKITHKTKFDRVTVGMVAGGKHRVIYDGRWPIR